ncbi:hypothetical protein CIK77_06015 [Microbacterium sp. JB110]|nr:hypothetical protein CIK77_06015 [Microbacterium sp. JB110]SJM44368.1 hypothetical protein CZ774_00885 [Frigoribacterium sp. JB110]
MRDGDLIRVDIAARAPDSRVGEAGLESRCSATGRQPPRFMRTAQAKLLMLVRSASECAMTG